MDNYRITLESEPDSSDFRVVNQGLVDYNIEQTHDDDFQLAVFLRDRDDKVVRGLIGETYWGWLHIEVVWVSESLRGKGYGTKLMAVAEAEAVRRGCQQAYLDTFSFQARPLYERLGYEVFGTLDDFPKGHQKFFMRKLL